MFSSRCLTDWTALQNSLCKCNYVINELDLLASMIYYLLTKQGELKIGPLSGYMVLRKWECVKELIPYNSLPPTSDLARFSSKYTCFPLLSSLHKRFRNDQKSFRHARHTRSQVWLLDFDCPKHPVASISIARRYVFSDFKDSHSGSFACLKFLQALFCVLN